jgi:glucose/arabinose dehydrogenase
MKRLFLILLVFGFAVKAQNELQWQPIAEGFHFITAIVPEPNDDTRLFIADLEGQIRIIENGILLDEPFLDVSGLISTETYGQGLTGMSFHPDYAENGFFYISYTPVGNSPILARYTVSDNPRVADAESAEIILQVDHASPWHNGGDIAFGQDDYLYWSMGDGAYKRSPSQNLRSHLGAILRLDVNGELPYEIPVDNPYLDNPDALPELWAKGLRNPWRFSFDSLTGDMYIADVGEAQMEEINFQTADSRGGENYGWNLFEGTWLYNGGSDEGLSYPVVEYPHDNGNCSITGGYVYRGRNLPELDGKYIFGDYCSGTIWTTYRQDNGNWFTAQLMETTTLITTFGRDNAGEIYLGDGRGGMVYKLISEQ